MHLGKKVLILYCNHCKAYRQGNLTNRMIKFMNERQTDTLMLEKLCDNCYYKLFIEESNDEKGN